MWANRSQQLAWDRARPGSGRKGEELVASDPLAMGQGELGADIRPAQPDRSIHP